MYLNKLKVVLIGMLCCIPFFQSLDNEDLSNLFSFVSIWLFNVPVYDMEMFSYHRTLPIGFFLLKGYIRLMEMLRSGKVKLIVESLETWLISMLPEMLKGLSGNL